MFDVQGLVNSVMAVVKLGVKDEELQEAWRWATVWEIREFNTHDLANRVRAFAKLDVKDKERLEAAGGRPEDQGVQRAKLSEHGVGLREAGRERRGAPESSAAGARPENLGVKRAGVWEHSVGLREAGCEG